MYSKTELEHFISNPPGHVEVDFAVELARQLLQEKQVSQDLQRVLNNGGEPIDMVM